MKALLILLFLAPLALGQEAVCQCGAFVSHRDGELEVLQFPPQELESCEEVERCSNLCEAEWRSITGGGDLCHELENGHTVGQQMCQRLSNHLGYDNLQPHDVYLYYNVCHGPWLYDEHVSKQQLECHNGHLAPDVCGAA